MVAPANKQPSETAMRIYKFLRQVDATAPERAVTDSEIARRVHCPVRNVIRFVAELDAIDVAILASCGLANVGRAGKGRYIEGDPAKVRGYGKRLHGRARSVHLRAKRYRDLAARMEEANGTDSRGQRRLFQ